MLSLYQIDAFTDKLFSGNPAGVVPLTEPLPESLMQRIAAENNLSETAFYHPEGDGYRLRWYTPTHEVDLCGHATLAAAHVLWQHEGYEGDTIEFGSKSGPLRVSLTEDGYLLDFPNDSLSETPVEQRVADALGVSPTTAMRGRRDLLLAFDNAQQVRDLQPDFGQLEKAVPFGVLCTAPADTEGLDFVSRCFYPAVGVPEDPVTGSAHTTLAPYWADRLGKDILQAKQISKRGGHLQCQVTQDRVLLQGQAVTYLIGQLQLDSPLVAELAPDEVELPPRR